MHPFFPCFHSSLRSKRLLWYTEAPSDSAPVTTETKPGLTDNPDAVRQKGQEEVNRAEKEAEFALKDYKNKRAAKAFLA